MKCVQTHLTLTGLLAFALFLCLCTHASAQDLESSAQKLTAMQEDLKSSSNKLLHLLKNLRDAGNEERFAAVIALADAPVHEADNGNARIIARAALNTEANILEEREDWFRIALPDGREGWIERSSILVRRMDGGGLAATAGSQLQQELLLIASTLRDYIGREAIEAERLYNQAAASFQDFSSSEQAGQRPLFEAATAAAGKIREYGIYAERYFTSVTKNMPLAETRSAYPGPIAGQITLQGGNSTYTAYEESKASAQNLQLNAGMNVSEKGRITTQLAHRAEVMQTPYASTTAVMGYQHALGGDLALRSQASINSFSDEVFSRNDFTRVGLGAALNGSVSPGTVLFADLRYDGKSYEDTTGNAYQGVHLNSNIRLGTEAESQWQLGLTGSAQSSDVNYLSFTRLVPSVQYMHRGTQGATTARAEFESMGYGEGGSINDYQRGQLNVTWMRGRSQRQLQATGKFYANNTALNYVRIGGNMRSSSGGLQYQRSLLSVHYLYFLEQDAGQTDYVDIRADQTSTGESFYWDVNLFGRIWSDFSETSTRDHLVDALGRFGWTIHGVQVGPTLGMHLRVRKGFDVLERDGNSLSTGAEARGMIDLGFGTVTLSFRYEMDMVYAHQFTIDGFGNVNSTGLVTRHPTTLQFFGDLRVPISADLEFSLVVDTYDVKLDVDDPTSIRPLGGRSRNNLMAGVGYRFSLQP